MRTFALLMMTLFIFQALDIPPLPAAKNPKTCCGRIVCQCQHEKGAFCPMRHLKGDSPQKRGQSPSVDHKHCHMKNKSAAKSEAPIVPLSDVRPANTSKSAFTKAPCSSDKNTPKSVLPGCAKEMEIHPLSFPAEFLDSSFPPVSFSVLLPNPQLIGIDHPPRSVSFSF